MVFKWYQGLGVTIAIAGVIAYREINPYFIRVFMWIPITIGFSLVFDYWRSTEDD
jgi:hypothetical protein